MRPASLLARRALAGAALAAALLPLAACSSGTPASAPTATQKQPEIGVLLAQAKSNGRPWMLSSDHDPAGRLCFELVDRSQGVEMARTCGLPVTAGTGYKLTPVHGSGTDTFYYAPLPAAAVKVRLDLAKGGSRVVDSQVAPAEMGKTPRFFITTLTGDHGAATLTLLDGSGAPLHS